METSLHRQLKSFYAGDDAPFEVPLGDFRIDVVSGGELIEIQHGSLAALRSKVGRLLEHHRVRIVKPIIARKVLVRQDARGGRVLSRRHSPKRGTMLDLFDELVYFRHLFPHARLTLEVILVDVEEWRYPGHGRRRRYRENDFEIEDQRLSTVHETFSLRTAADLRKLLRVKLPATFHTGHLADALGIKRFVAQKIAYCLRHCGAADQIGKQGNAALYKFRKRSAA